MNFQKMKIEAGSHKFGLKNQTSALPNDKLGIHNPI